MSDTCRDDERHLRHCLELAARARGQTFPNPLVGAVVVRDGEVVGTGFHARAGEAHAERQALMQAGAAARGATLYTNVEPCSHTGRTPPCVEAILAAGVARVVTCIRDPDPRVDGRGLRALRGAGVQVHVGLLAREAAELNAGYLSLKQQGRPFVIAKAALSLDGRMATHTGNSQWITGAPARQHAHLLRSRVDAVVVGSGTVLADDPQLTARDVEGPGPRFRVVLDSRLRTPSSARLLAQNQGKVVVITGEPGPGAERLRAAGAAVIGVAVDAEGRVSLPAALRALAELGVSTVLLEGGSTVLTCAFEVGTIDQVVLYYAPVLLGGAAAPPLWGGAGHALVAAAPRLRFARWQTLGEDQVVEGYLRPPTAPDDDAGLPEQD